MTRVQSLERKFLRRLTYYCNLPNDVDPLESRRAIERMQESYADLRTERQLIGLSVRVRSRLFGNAPEVRA
jgi:hypothetical protein